MTTGCLKCAFLLVLLAVAVQPAGARARKTTLTGSIIAFRPGDVVIQMASFVENNEEFLFSTSGSRPAVVKLVHQHIGYSVFNGDLIAAKPVLRLKATRDLSCDETYSSFVMNAPLIRLEGSTDTKGKSVLFVSGPEGIEPAKDHVLKCYRVRQVRASEVKATVQVR